MTVDGVMRHPSFEGMREDKIARDVHAEVAVHLSEKPTKKLAIKLAPVKKKERKTLLNPAGVRGWAPSAWSRGAR